MSAFPVSDETLYVMVYAAMKGPHGTSWYHYAKRKGHRLRQCDFDEADRVVSMLKTENRRSLEARYPRDAAETWPEILEPIAFPRTLAFATDPTPVEVLKTIACYEYQACEHEGWRDSEAFAFCVGLRHAMIAELPGYENATGWDWSTEEFQKRRGGMVSLTGMIFAKKNGGGK